MHAHHTNATCKLISEEIFDNVEYFIVYNVNILFINHMIIIISTTVLLLYCTINFEKKIHKVQFTVQFIFIPFKKSYASISIN